MDVYTTKKESVQVLLQYAKLLQEQFDNCSFHFIRSMGDMFQVETLAFRALATLKSSSSSTTLKDLDLNKRDPMNQVSSMIRRRRQKSSQAPPHFLHDYSPAQQQSIEIDPSKVYLLQFDGGARSDFGVAGVGMVIYDDSTKQEIWSGWYFHDDNVTNNIAEYLAMLFGLKIAESLRIQRLIVQGDSLLVVRQMNEEYWTREGSLTILRDEARQVAKAFESCKIDHIPRRYNKRADWLACHAMDKGNTYGFHFV